MSHSLRVLHNIMCSLNDWHCMVQVVELLWNIRVPLVPPHPSILLLAAEVDQSRHQQDQDCNKNRAYSFEHFSAQNVWSKEFFSSRLHRGQISQMYSGQSLKTPACRKVCKTYSTIDSDSRKQP